MSFALVSKSRRKRQSSVKPVPQRKSARAQHPTDSQVGFAKPVFQPQTAALPTVPVMQAKPKVGEPDDKFEEEADQVAELTENGNGSISLSAAMPSRSPVGSLQRLYGNQAVLQMRSGSGGLPAPSVPWRPSQSGILQRKCSCGGSAGMSGGCEECSQKQQFGLQTKLKISEPGDSYEREADRIADQVMATPAHPAISGASPRIQRVSGQLPGQPVARPASVDQALTGPGRALEPVLQQDMEQRFGYDFSQVRVHAGAAAAQSAREVNAHAYTVGHNMVFGAGRFAPGTPQGRRLIAHELTHVVQQSGSEGIHVDSSNEKHGLSPMSLAKTPRNTPARALLVARKADPGKDDATPVAISGPPDQLVANILESVARGNPAFKPEHYLTAVTIGDKKLLVYLGRLKRAEFDLDPARMASSPPGIYSPSDNDTVRQMFRTGTGTIEWRQTSYGDPQHRTIIPVIEKQQRKFAELLEVATSGWIVVRPAPVAGGGGGATHGQEAGAGGEGGGTGEGITEAPVVPKWARNLFEFLNGQLRNENKNAARVAARGAQETSVDAVTRLRHEAGLPDKLTIGMRGTAPVLGVRAGKHLGTLGLRQDQGWLFVWDRVRALTRPLSRASRRRGTRHWAT